MFVGGERPGAFAESGGGRVIDEGWLRGHEEFEEPAGRSLLFPKGAQVDNERAKGEILSLRKLVEDLGGENRTLKEQCWSVEEKERAAADRVEHLSLDIADLTDKVTKLTLDLEEQRLQRKKAEDNLVEFKGFVLEQHDLGFMRAVRQAAFFY